MKSMENEQAAIVVNSLLEAEQPPQEQDKSPEFWDRYSASVDNISSMAKESRGKFNDLSRGLKSNMHKYGEKGKQFSASLDKLGSHYDERDALLAKMRYAAAYRRALAKAGVKLGDVVGRNSTWSRRRPLHGNLNASYITQVVLRDGSKVEIDPVEIPKSKGS
jgi:hypothetical protein